MIGRDGCGRGRAFRRSGSRWPVSSLGAPDRPPADSTPIDAAASGGRAADPLADHAARARAVRAVARGVRVGRPGRRPLVIGSRGGDRRRRWRPTAATSTGRPAVSGGVDSAAAFDSVRRQVYIGADDGSFYAIDPDRQAPLDLPRQGGDRAAGRGRPELVYVASAADRIVALEAATGKWRWQYEREMPEGFTIHGYAGPAAARDAAPGRLRRRLLGLADGGDRRGPLGAVAGRGVRPVRRRRHDPDGRATTSPTSRRTRAAFTRIDARDGDDPWRVGIEGVGDITADAERLYFVAPRGAARHRAATGTSCGDRG